MSALTCYQGLEERFRTVSGLHSVVLGEPTGDLDLPGLYTAYIGFDRTLGRDQMTVMEHRFMHRLIIRWQDNAQAEMQLLTLLNAIPASVELDIQLGGRLLQGIARISSQSHAIEQRRHDARVAQIHRELLDRHSFQAV